MINWGKEFTYISTNSCPHFFAAYSISPFLGLKMLDFFAPRAFPVKIKDIQKGR